MESKKPGLRISNPDEQDSEPRLENNGKKSAWDKALQDAADQTHRWARLANPLHYMQNSPSYKAMRDAQDQQERLARTINPLHDMQNSAWDKALRDAQEQEDNLARLINPRHDADKRAKEQYEEDSKRWRESDEALARIRGLNEQRLKEIHKQAYLEALRQYEAESKTTVGMNESTIPDSQPTASTDESAIQDSDEQTKREAALSSWLADSKLTSDEIKNLTQAEIHEQLKKYSKLFFIEKDSFKKFWQHQKIIKLKQGRRKK